MIYYLLYDEEGKVKANINALGTSKTEYIYLNGTNLVAEELSPNGSKYAYGRDFDNNVNSITLSSDEGEESKVQKVYNYNEVV